MNTRALALILAAAASGIAADRNFDRLAAAVESHFGVRRTHIPLMGVANFFVKVARPEGARGFKLAMFEDLRLTPEDGGALDRMMADAAAGLHPMIRTHSDYGRERTYVYTGGAGLSKMFIVSFERDEATIVEVALDSKVLARILADPARAGRAFAGTDDDHEFRNSTRDRAESQP